MKKIGLFLIISAFCFSLSLSGTLFAAPVIVVENPLFDAGQNPAGTTVSHTFLVRNDGKDPLIIEKVIPSCGCTLASYDDFIAPGKTGKILVNVDLYKEWAGQNYRKTVTVVSNDPKNSNIVLSVAGSIGQPGSAPRPKDQAKTEAPLAAKPKAPAVPPDSFNLVVRRGDE
jgi:hypothetical protein